jgi:undecaprenyl-diphosphatase
MPADPHGSAGIRLPGRAAGAPRPRGPGLKALLLLPFPAWDDTLFIRLNQHAHAGWLDPVMAAFTRVSEETWVLVGAGLLAAVLFRGRTRRIWILCLVAVGLTDLTVDRLIKPWVGRPRPFDAGLPVRLLAPLRHSRGFPSSHAANFAALAAVLVAAGTRAAAWAVPLALLAGYSRIYVGVHRPLDVLAGWAYGSVAGWLVARAGRRWIAPGPVATLGPDPGSNES